MPHSFEDVVFSGNNRARPELPALAHLSTRAEAYPRQTMRPGSFVFAVHRRSL